jgi:hypothetical protein
MKYFITILSLAIFLESRAQIESEITGKQFIALSVASTAASSAWYEQLFNMKLVKEIKPADQSVHIRIIGNENLTIEIIQLNNSKSLADCSLPQGETHRLKGIFKTGLYVKDIEWAEKYFRGKNVPIRHSIFEDSEMQIRSFIMTDLDGNMIQILQQTGK